MSNQCELGADVAHAGLIWPTSARRITYFALPRALPISTLYCDGATQSQRCGLETELRELTAPSLSFFVVKRFLTPSKAAWVGNEALF